MQKVDQTLDYIKIYTGCNDIALKRIRPLLVSLYEDNKRFVIKQVIGRTKEKHLNHIDKSIPLAYETQPFHEWVMDYCKENEVTIEELSKRCRKMDSVFRRNKFIINANMHKFKTVDIARLLKMHHATVIHAKYYYKLPNIK